MQWKHWLPLYLHSKSTRLKRRVLFSLEALQIEGRVGSVDIALVQLFPEQLGSLAEALEVDDLPLPQELDHVVHIRVIGQPQDVVVRYPCFLLRYKSNTQSVTVLPVTVTVRRAGPLPRISVPVGSRTGPEPACSGAQRPPGIAPVPHSGWRTGNTAAPGPEGSA